MRGARAVRQTLIKLADGPTLAEVTTEWIWVRAEDGRPMCLPAAVLENFGS